MKIDARHGAANAHVCTDKALARTRKAKYNLTEMKFHTDKKNFATEGRLRVGIMSDSQLSCLPWRKDSVYERNTRRAFEVFANLGCNVILFAGDICNTAGAHAYRTFARCLESAYGEKQPVVQLIMGNHDYYLRPFARRLFRGETGQSPFTHYVVNGYHFIGASPDCASMRRGYAKTARWLDAELRVACEAHPDRPVFVLAHNAPKYTVYGSDDWGDETLDEVLSKYPRAVVFAGHSHYSLLDERSVYRGKYTVLNTQSVSYVEMERGKANGSVPPAAHSAPMGYVMDLDDTGAVVSRFRLSDGKEMKADRRIVLTPCTDDAENRAACTADADGAPSMTEERGGFRISDDGVTRLAFARGRHADFVHSYRVVFSDGTEQTYFSDFYLGDDSAADIVELPVYGKAAGVYDVRIYALDSFGRRSADCTRIDGVAVARKVDYKRKLAPDIRY